MIVEAKWEWFGSPAHFICASDCRFHMATKIGRFIVSTVGEYLPDSAVREILANSRNKPLEGRGDARRADWMKKFGYEEIGYGRKYETMVFRTKGRCKAPDCGCGLPIIIPRELDMNSYNTAGDATKGHMKLCRTWASK